LPPDPEIERQARERMAEPMVLLTDEQRAIVERTIADLEAARPTLDGFVHVPDLACHEGIGAASGGGLSAGAWSRSPSPRCSSELLATNDGTSSGADSRVKKNQIVGDRVLTSSWIIVKAAQPRSTVL